MHSTPAHIVVMGVSGSGKSSVGQRLAAALGYLYIEGDSHHPDSNVAKMRRNIPLTDDDRWPWLRRLAALMHESRSPVVLACSALKRSYRDELRRAGPVVLVYLEGERDLIARRMGSRTGHFMSPALLDSQFATLEPPATDEHSIAVSVEWPVAAIVAAVLQKLAADFGIQLPPATDEKAP